MDKEKTSLGKVLLFSVIIFNALDALLTVTFVYLFGIAGEANPIAGAALKVSPILFVALKFLLSAFLYFAARKHLEDKRTVILLGIVFAIYMSVIVCFIWGALSLPFQMLMGTL